MHDVVADSPALRRVVTSEAPVRPDGEYVLYWMRASRRLVDNFALDRAVAWCHELGRPLLVLEALRCDYPWAADRHHAFVLDGMRDNLRTATAAGVALHAYVEPTVGAGKGLLAALATRACVVVTDFHPSFHFPAMLRAGIDASPVRLEAIDGVGLVPLRATATAAGTAYAFRRQLQQLLPIHLERFPRARPLRDAVVRGAVVPADITRRWPAADADTLAATPAALARLPIDHAPGRVDVEGGPRAAAARLSEFLASGLGHYGDRNHPDRDATSGLSPHLHFGHIGPHAVLRAIGKQHDWTPADLGAVRNGAREGFWGLPSPVEGFLDQLVTWRELGHNFATHRDDLERYDSLPTWALQTLERHAGDPRGWHYDRDALERGVTHDPIWNAAQTELRERGAMHNYLRMLWGKLVLQWSEHPRVALEHLIHLNNRWALDGRDPNSYSGILWTFGRYDRPWGPERPIFGTVRYMTSQQTRRKLQLAAYLARYGHQRRLA